MSKLIQNHSKGNKTLITVFIMITTIMQVMDMTIANVALPHIKGSLSASKNQISWIVTSYIISAAIMTQPISWLANHFGRKRIFLISVIGFTISSALCGMATSIIEIIIFRMLQGIFGAALVPLSCSVLLDINPKEKHGSAMAIWGMGVMIGPIMGPVIGGYLTEYYNWRWVFYINVPLGIISSIGIIYFLHESQTVKKSFNFIGFGLLSIFIGSLQLFLDKGQNLDWFNSHEIVIYFALMIISLWMFIIHNIYSNKPFISYALFKDLNFVVSTVIIFVISIVFMSTLSLLPSFLGSVMGYTVLDVGLLIAPRGIGSLLAMMLVGKIINKIDPRSIVVIGLLLMIYALYELSNFSTFVPEEMIIFSGIINGFGIGFIFAPLSTIAFSTISNQNRNEATAFFSLMRNIGSSIGVSVVTFLLIRNIQINHSYLSEFITKSKFWILQHYSPQFFNNKKMMSIIIDKNINIQAETIAYLDNFKIMMICVISLIPLLLLLRNPYKDSKKSS